MNASLLARLVAYTAERAGHAISDVQAFVRYDEYANRTICNLTWRDADGSVRVERLQSNGWHATPGSCAGREIDAAIEALFPPVFLDAGAGI